MYTYFLISSFTPCPIDSTLKEKGNWENNRNVNGIDSQSQQFVCFPNRRKKSERKIHRKVECGV